MTIKRRRQGALALAVIVAIAGHLIGIYDTPLAVLLIGALGLIGTKPRLPASLLAIVLVTIGVVWSSMDQSGCSVWWSGKAVYQKVLGRLPYADWATLADRIFAGCYTSVHAHAAVGNRLVKLGEKPVNGHALEQYRSDIGEFWLPAPGRKLLTFLTWEVAVRRDYTHGTVRVRPGDVVIDCGAHVGVFSRHALNRGARQVIAVEPDPTNVACLRENFREEIQSGRVVVMPVGVWSETTRLNLSTHDDNSAAHSFIFAGDHASDGLIEALPLDNIVEQLELDRVDFIKMDIEGSERFALQGARRTLERFQPRMAICVYHQPDDYEVVPTMVLAANRNYSVSGKALEPVNNTIRLKVLFFE